MFSVAGKAWDYKPKELHCSFINIFSNRSIVVGLIKRLPSQAVALTVSNVLLLLLVKKCLKVLEKRYAKADGQGDVGQTLTDEKTGAKPDADGKAGGQAVEGESKQNDAGDLSDTDGEEGFAMNENVGPIDPEGAIAGEADSLTALRHPSANRQLDLIAYYIDYNGFSYGPVENTWEIRWYEGERDITSFDIYPMQFYKDCEKLKTKLHDQGKAFQNVIAKKHPYYDGWTLANGPTGNGQDGEADSESDKSVRIEPEHIEGDVIIDFVEGYKARSTIKMPTFLDSSLDDSDWPTGDDALPIRCFKNGPESELLGEIKEVTQRNDLVGNYLKIRHKKQCKLLQTWQTTNVTQLEEGDLILLPRRAVAYAFRERKFVMLDVEALKNVPPAQNVFGDLQIDPANKRMVKFLVKAHFRKQKPQKEQPSAGLNQDLIRGKGSGLFILLHGVPGVGKTATAEAVAQANKKPLFTITCGDLGFEPKQDCVLLLDEADIFLTRREHNDLQRNALVSVFLRVLEYYSGILFLTTNRVGILDEAFESRIHVSLYYPPLSKEQTLAIFEVNIQDFLGQWDDDNADIDAYAENAGAEGVQQAASRLDFRHFKIVAKVIEKFEHYLFDAMQGNTDMDLNRTNWTRDDAHDPNSWDEGPSYRPPFRTQRQERRPNQQQRPSYKPPPKEYQPPQEEPQVRPKQRQAPQGMQQNDNGRLRARGSPSKVTPRSKPSIDRRDDSGYSGWSTSTTGPSPSAFPNEEYPADEDEEIEGGHQDYVEGDDQYYDDEYEEEYQTNRRSRFDAFSLLSEPG
ncbi:uncharacterized protein PAC_10176 [Phialocephala subalpina]|uniref:AAA+ ATPase domain-containing protein n=1 Tax=Phialocephala subalpina TaxID=576137 RepID=A0A1L7X5H5_9HELO|nr:uncharacterized protein PAC_10176 [Phialocephala subalpina]